MNNEEKILPEQETSVENTNPEKKLSKGALIGIIAGAVALVAVVISVIPELSVIFDIIVLFAPSPLLESIKVPTLLQQPTNPPLAPDPTVIVKTSPGAT